MDITNVNEQLCKCPIGDGKRSSSGSAHSGKTSHCNALCNKKILRLIFTDRSIEHVEPSVY